MNITNQSTTDKSRSSVSGSSGNHNVGALTLSYTCLPSSTALSPNAHVTLAIRSFHTNIHPTSLKSSSSFDNNDFGHHDMQLYVSAQVLGIGSLPLHSVTVDSVGSTVLGPLHNLSSNDQNENHHSLPHIPTIDMNPGQLSYNFPAKHYCCTWDHESIRQQSDMKHRNIPRNRHHQNVLTLPVRYKDLSHDASIKLIIYTSRNIKIGTVTLPLWDEKRRLKMGLQKLKINLEEAHKDNSSSNNKETFLECNNINVHKEVCKDETWEACLILDKLSQMEKISLSKKTGSTTHGDSSINSDNRRRDQKPHDKINSHYQIEDLNITINGLHNCNSMQSVPWLDSFTKEYCMDILKASHEGENKLKEITSLQSDTSIEKKVATKDHNYDSGRDSFSSAVSVSEGDAYLIVELQQCEFPIVYHEQPYGLHNGNSPGANAHSVRGSNTNAVLSSIVDNHSASGSITALDLSFYHHQSMIESGKQNINDSSKPYRWSTNMPHLVHALDESQEMGLKLVQVLDFECMGDNPVEDKYRTLQHELLRGLVDPALKPDASERAQLNAIISGTSQHLTREEKDLLWRFRFSLVDNRRALTKFLLAVEWTVESEVVQAAELLEQWRKRSPIEVSDALRLLGKNVAFQTGLVRAYAIDTLALADDRELVLYLLQLVQALKYENATDEQTGLSSLNQFRGSPNAKKGEKTNNSLANFLIERASKNIELANYLYWYLKVELDDPIYGRRFLQVFLALKNKLRQIPFEVNKPQLHQSHSKFKPLSGVLDSVSKISGGNSKKLTSTNITMWDILDIQDQFISNVVECQLESRESRGKKDAKEKYLRETLQKKGCHTIANGCAIPLPSAPHIWITGVKADSARMFKSALYPALLEFFVDQNVSCDGAGVEKSKVKTYQVMVKTGDDLRQDQLVIMMIKLMDRILKRGALDLFLNPYPILAMSDRTGLVEFVPSNPISQILSENNNSILEYFQKVAPSKGSKYDVDPDVIQTYVRSCAGYCVITYLIGVGDRHLDNIMLQKSGHFFHIDFGFIFGRDPKPLPPAFRLTKEMVDGMGGQDSQEYRQFCSLACQAYNLLRKRAGLVLNLLYLMSDAGIEDLSNNPSYDADGVIAEVEKRFKLDLTDEQAENFFLQLIKESVSALAPRVMEMFHQLSVARR